jgi:hypothetical protein
MEALSRHQAAGRAAAGRRPDPWLAVRALGALAVLVVGIIHLQQYFKLYSAIPTIGTLFVLNFAGATAIGLGLLAPVEHLLGRRFGAAAVGLLALAGVGLAATAFVFLAISEHTPLFGFMEPGYDPTAILASRLAEGAAILLLTGFLIARFFGRWSTGRW